MLKKLLAYDMRYIFKFISIFYALALFFGVLTRIFLNVENSLVTKIIGEICNGASISMMVSILINSTMRLWVRFKENLYGDESYLTHTLPVNKKELYLSKAITASVVLPVSMLVIVSNLFIMYYLKGMIENIKTMLARVLGALKLNIYVVFAILLVNLFLEFANVVQCGYTGIILGHRINNNKVGFSVLFAFVIYIASQGIVLLSVFMVALFNSDFMNLFMTAEIVEFGAVKAAAYISVAVYALLLFVLCFVNVKLFKKGVNVD